MKFTWLIVFLVLSIVPSLIARFKRQSAATDISSDDDGQEDDSFFGFEEPEAEQEPVRQTPYFTYEASKAEVKHSEPVATVAAAFAEEPARPAFDLRQAVIYQTLLTNNYNNFGN